MIRFLLVCITVIGFLILSIPILIVEWIIGKFNPYKKDISSLHLIQSVFRFILWLTGVEVTVIGEELVPTDEAVLYIGNHRSFFDILLTYTRCPRLTGYIAKAEMEKITDCLIVPIAMNNTVSIFEKQFPKIRKNHVVLEYCKPFRPSELSKEDQKHIGEYTRTRILETLKKNEPLV